VNRFKKVLKENLTIGVWGGNGSMGGGRVPSPQRYKHFFNRCVAECCGVLQYVAVRCSVLQCVAVIHHNWFTRRESSWFLLQVGRTSGEKSAMCAFFGGQREYWRHCSVVDDASQDSETNRDYRPKVYHIIVKIELSYHNNRAVLS